MKQKIKLSLSICHIFILVISLMATTFTFGSQFSNYPNDTKISLYSGPYFGQVNPGIIPVRFVPGMIPDGAYAITFSPEGTECFFSKVNSIGVIMTTKETNGSWPNPAYAFFSGTYTDLEAHISPDGNRLFFSSLRPLPGTPSGSLHLYCMEKTSTGWTNPAPMGSPLKELEIMYPSVASNGNLYFTDISNPDTSVIKVSKFLNGQYQTPESLGDSVNYLNFPAHPFIAPDESYIIFDAAIVMPGHISDLFISYKKTNGSWSKAISLGDTINTNGTEMCPFVSRNGMFLFLARNGNTYWVDARYYIRTVGINKIEKSIPNSFTLAQNYPNPFNPITKIPFTLKKSGDVELGVFDCSGKLVTKLVNEYLTAGMYDVDWNASSFSSGIYFYRIKAENFRDTKKMILIK